MIAILDRSLRMLMIEDAKTIECLRVKIQITIFPVARLEGKEITFANLKVKNIIKSIDYLI